MGLYRRKNTSLLWFSIPNPIPGGKRIQESAGTSNWDVAELVMAKRRLEVSEGTKRLTTGQLRTINDILMDLDGPGRTLVEMLLRSISMEKDTPPDQMEEQTEDTTADHLEALASARQTILEAEPDNSTTVDNEVLADILTTVRELKAGQQDKRTTKTLGDLRDEWNKVKASKKSLRDDKQRLSRFLQFLGNGGKPVSSEDEAALTQAELAGAKIELHDVTADQCQAFLDSLAAAELSKGTINRHIALLKSLFTHADKKEWRHQNPMKAISLAPEKGRTRTATEAEYQALIAKASPGLKLAIILAYQTGMRRGEIAQLDPTKHLHLNDPAGPHFVLEEDMTKGEAARVVPLNDECVKAIKARPQLVKMAKDTITADFNALRDELGFGDLHFHDLRASFATNMLRAGVDAITVSRLTGHKSIDILNKRYARLNRKDLMDAVNKRGQFTKKQARKPKNKGKLRRAKAP